MGRWIDIREQFGIHITLAQTPSDIELYVIRPVDQSVDRYSSQLTEVGFKKSKHGLYIAPKKSIETNKMLDVFDTELKEVSDKLIFDKDYMSSDEKQIQNQKEAQRIVSLTTEGYRTLVPTYLQDTIINLLNKSNIDHGLKKQIIYDLTGDGAEQSIDILYNKKYWNNALLLEISPDTIGQLTQFEVGSILIGHITNENGFQDYSAKSMKTVKELYGLTGDYAINCIRSYIKLSETIADYELTDPSQANVFLSINALDADFHKLNTFLNDNAGEKIGGSKAEQYWLKQGVDLDALEDMSSADIAQGIHKRNVWKMPDLDDLQKKGVSAYAYHLYRGIFNDIPKQPRPLDSEDSAFCDGDDDRNRKRIAKAYVTNVLAIKLLCDEYLLKPNSFDDDTNPKNSASFIRSLDSIVEQDIYKQYKNSDARTEAVRGDKWIEYKIYRRKSGQRKRSAVYNGGRFQKALSYNMTYKTRSSFAKKISGFVGSDKYHNEEYSLSEEWEAIRSKGTRRINHNKKRVPARSAYQGSIQRFGFDEKSNNVSSEQILKQFNFRGVEYGNWVNQTERQTNINHAYDALNDLAHILGVQPRDIGIKYADSNKCLSAAFGARGKGRAAAHYEPHYRVFNLTKMNGAGSLAHEYCHAIDHAIGVELKIIAQNCNMQLPADEYMATNLISSLDLLVVEKNNPEYLPVIDSFQELHKAMTFATFDSITPDKFKKSIQDHQRRDNFGRIHLNIDEDKSIVRNSLHKKIQQFDSLDMKRCTYGFQTDKEMINYCDTLNDLHKCYKQAIKEDLIPSVRVRRELPIIEHAIESMNSLSTAFKAVDNMTKNGRLQTNNKSIINQVNNLFNMVVPFSLDISSEEKAIQKLNSGLSGSNYCYQAYRIDKESKGRSAYWLTNHEMFARAFEAYVFDSIEAQNKRSDYLVNSVGDGQYSGSEYRGDPYPSGAEREHINHKIDRLLNNYVELKQYQSQLLGSTAKTSSRLKFA